MNKMYMFAHTNIVCANIYCFFTKSDNKKATSIVESQCSIIPKSS